VSDTADRYRRLLRSFLKAREEAGGTLSATEEGRYIEELDRLWEALSPAEQAELDRELTS
jgi:hypothetical protein